MLITIIVIQEFKTVVANKAGDKNKNAKKYQKEIKMMR